MQKTKPLAVSRDVVNAVCVHVIDASLVNDPRWRERRFYEIDSILKPLVEALEDANNRLFDHHKAGRTSSLAGDVCEICAREPQIFRRIDAALKRAKGE